MPPFRSDFAVLTSLYTLTPTHCGTGQTTGAVDLPIARESHTGFPILPATSLKGVARDTFEKNSEVSDDLVRQLFGPPAGDPQLSAGALIFTEARLLALPVRSLNRPYLYVTCPLILERLERDLRAFDITGIFPSEWVRPQPQEQQMQVADAQLAGQTLVLEDLVYQATDVAVLPQLTTLAESFAALLPGKEAATRQRLQRDVVVVPDQDMADLAQRTIPVQARIQLTDSKTTAPSLTMDGMPQEGNLWYEEVLPADCLFACFILTRPQRRFGNREANGTHLAPDALLTDFLNHTDDLAFVQIGGNESVGQGWCWWVFPDHTPL